MVTKRGFSLMEIIATLVIIGVATALILPNLSSSTEVTKAQVAWNTLLAISAAQQRYFEDNSAYSSTSGSSLMSALRLSASPNDPFVYTCSTATSPYKCTAADSKDTLTLTVTALGVTVTCAGPSGYCPSN